MQSNGPLHQVYLYGMKMCLPHQHLTWHPLIAPSIAFKLHSILHPHHAKWIKYQLTFLKMFPDSLTREEGSVNQNCKHPRGKCCESRTGALRPVPILSLTSGPEVVASLSSIKVGAHGSGLRISATTSNDTWDIITYFLLTEFKYCFEK